MAAPRIHFYSLILEIEREEDTLATDPAALDFRLGEITVDWIDFTREKSVDRIHLEDAMTTTSSPANGSARKKTHASSSRHVPGSAPASPPHPPGRRKPHPNLSSPDSLSLQPLLAHVPQSSDTSSDSNFDPNPLGHSYASGVSNVGRGVVHLFRHAPPPSLIGRLDGQRGEGSKSAVGEWAGERAEGEDGSLVAILAVPAWMRPADFLEFIGGWATGLEGVRMIREATTPNRSIVLLKFRDPLQAQDFMVIFTGRSFSTLEPRETCHPIRVHHLVLHKSEGGSPTAVPAFPPSVYASRQRHLPDSLSGVPAQGRYELPSCPVCLERLDSTVTGLVTLPCAHTFDCDCLRKWGDSRCPVCRVSHLLLSSTSTATAGSSSAGYRSIGTSDEATRASKCSMCDSTENNWICVVCGVVGCGRYSPGKAHARRHWEESGHVLAMELETQRVWDYQGDNYVHRLIQTRTDGKLVELPSASSLVTPSAPRTLPLNRSLRDMTPQPNHPSAESSPQARARDSSELDRDRLDYPSSGHDHDGDRDGSDEAGPSSNDIDKMSTIEAITLEYSYLLSSQLEAMRQHYETQFAKQRSKIDELAATCDRLKEMEDARLRAEAMRDEAERAREKAERKADRASTLARDLQVSLGAERAMAQGLTERVGVLGKKAEAAEAGMKEKAKEVDELNETVRDLMFSLEAGMKIQEGGGEDMGEGGSLVVVPGKKKGKGKK